jgi:hypothetical protein
MIFYTLLYLIILGFITFDFVKISLNVKKILLVFVMIVFTIVVGISNDIGGDIPSYKVLFEEAPYLEDFVFGSYYKESGYVFLNSFFKRFFNSFNAMLFFITAVNFFFLYKILVYKYFQKFMFFSFYIYITGYMFAGMFGLLRQHIVMSIFLFALLMYFKNKKFNFLLITAFGMLFHRISAIYILFVYFFNKKYSIKKYNTIFILSFALGISGMLFIILINTIGFFSTPEIQSALLKVKTYYISQLNKSVINLAFFEKSLLFFIFIFYYKKLVELNPINYLLINIFFINIFIYMLMIQDLGLAGRISKVFKIVEILLIPQLFLISIKKNVKTGLFLFFVILGFAHYYKELLRNLEYFVPYSTIF